MAAEADPGHLVAMAHLVRRGSLRNPGGAGAPQIPKSARAPGEHGSIFISWVFSIHTNSCEDGALVVICFEHLRHVVTLETIFST